MSTLTHATANTARIAAVTAAAPVLIGAAASSATAELVGWELRQLASSPLSAEARRLRAEYRELAATSNVGAKAPAAAQRDSAQARSDMARTRLVALNA